MDFSAAPAVRLAKAPTLAVQSDPDERVAAIYAAHDQRLVGLATVLGGGRAVGEEIAHETFLTALRQERRKPGYLTDPVWPWLRITAVRLAGRNRQRLLREAMSHRRWRGDADISDAWGGTDTRSRQRPAKAAFEDAPVRDLESASSGRSATPKDRLRS